jgi:hypothetical protein
MFMYDHMIICMYIVCVYTYIYIIYLYDNMIIYDNPQIFWILVKSAPGAEGLEGLIAGCR